MPGSKKFGDKKCSVTPGCTRKQRYADGGCDPCHWRTLDEGTAKKTPSAARLANIKLVNDYNKLIRKGMKPHEIAALWGLYRKKLATKIYRAKKFYGLKVINGSTVRWVDGKPQEPTPIKAIRAKVSDHGEGTKGKKGCKEECCMSVRRTHWRRANENYRANVKRREEQAAAQQSDEMA